MLELLAIFGAQFLTVFLLGVQSLMVRDHNYSGAFVGSLLIGLSQFYIYRVVQDINVNTAAWYTFLIAGPIAIVTAMYFHKSISNLFRRIYNKQIQ